MDIPGIGVFDVDLTGPTQVTRGPIGDSDNDGLEDISLTVDAMDLQGTDPVVGPLQLILDQGQPSTGFAEEDTNNVPGQLEPPFVSQLDMFVRVTFGIDTVLVTREPIPLSAGLSEIPPAPGESYDFAGQVELFDAQTGQPFGFITRVIHIVRPGGNVVEHDVFPETTATLVVEVPKTAALGVLTPKPVLPPIGSVFLSPDGAVTGFQGPGIDIILTRVRHRPLAFPPPTIVVDGQDERQTFQSSLQGRATVNGEEFEIDLSGPVEVIVRGKVGQTTGTFDTEMISMSLSGDIPGGPTIEIRESQERLSPGQTKITDLGDGQFQIDSFFDVFTEISVDGGRNFIPSGESLRVDAAESGITIPAIPNCRRTRAPTATRPTCTRSSTAQRCRSFSKTCGTGRWPLSTGASWATMRWSASILR